MTTSHDVKRTLVSSKVYEFTIFDASKGVITAKTVNN